MKISIYSDNHSVSILHFSHVYIYIYSLSICFQLKDNGTLAEAYMTKAVLIRYKHEEQLKVSFRFIARHIISIISLTLGVHFR